MASEADPSDKPAYGASLSGPAHRKRWRRVIGVMVAVGVVVAAVGAVYTYVGCAGTNARVVDVHDAGEAALSRMVDGRRGNHGAGERHAGGEELDRSKACLDPMVLKVEMAGSFTRNSDIGAPRGPSVIAPSTVPVSLGMPLLAAEFSIAELCSSEEVSPSYIRLVCLHQKGHLSTIEYRIDTTYVVNLVDGRDRGLRASQIPVACAKLDTHIPKRDLTRLAKAYLNDRPSEQCADSKAPRRKVAANLVRRLDADSIWANPCSKSRCCYEYTGVQLSLPLGNVGPFQDLGKLRAQCFGPCNASRSKKPNGFSVHCIEGDGVNAYQLGDALYIAEDARVRKVPLPCGVELDFQLQEFMASLSPGNITAD